MTPFMMPANRIGEAKIAAGMLALKNGSAPPHISSSLMPATWPVRAT